VKVLFDADWWVDGPPSGRSVVRSLVRAWAEVFPGDELTLQVKPHRTADVRTDLASSEIRARVIPNSILARNHAISVLLTRARKKDFDAFISHNFAPLRGSATNATLVYDVIYLEHPEWFTRLERLYLSLIRPTLVRSDIVFAISRSESERLIRFWPKLAPKIRTIGLGVSRELTDAKPSRPEITRDWARPYVLAVGRLNVRKNLERLIAAYVGSGEVHASHDLLLVGPPDGATGLHALIPRALESSILLTGEVADAELAWLYRNAALFAFPSLDEAYGLPLVEAYLAGAPIVASDIPAFRELALASDYFNPRSTEDIGRSLESGVKMGRRRPSAGAESAYDWTMVVRKMRAHIRTVRKGRRT
jgi:glycosyltransferase involved in cell wall biosynthesis